MRKLGYRKSFVTRIVLVFLAFNILSVLAFTYYVNSKEETTALTYAKQSMSEIVNEKSELISICFNRVESQASTLGIWFEKLLNTSAVNSQIGEDYIIDEAKRTLSRVKDSTKKDIEQSSVTIPSTTPVTDKLREEIALTEELDEPFMQALQYEDITWAYIVTESGLLRYSPFSDSHVFESNQSQTKEIFYTIAQEENNPNRDVVWTKPYTDYLGTGWTMTCSKPVYRNNQMYGVICLDIAINNIKKKYFDGFSMGKSGKVYWLDKEGNIFYHPDYESEATVKGQIYEENIFDQVLLSENKATAIKQALTGDNSSGIVSFEEDFKRKMIFYSEIKNTNSTLIIEMDREEFISENKINTNRALALLAIEFVITVALALLLYFKFSKPMKALVEDADKISKGQYDLDVGKGNDGGYYEISQLSKAFSTMNMSIKTYTETLIDKNREISTILETIEGNLMVVDKEGNVLISSKENNIIPKENYMKAMEIVFETKKPFEEEMVIDGEIYKNVYYPIVKNDFKVDQIVVSNECITKRLLLEKELQQTEKMAGVGQLAAAIVHELKNTMALIKGAAYLIEATGGKNMDNEEELALIKNGVDEAEKIMTTLLDFSRNDSKEEEECIQIEPVVNQILLLSRKVTIGKNITIETKIDENCILETVGKTELKIILQNIINNAIQVVSEDGKIVIKGSMTEVNAVVTVEDNGEGIAIEPKEKIFDPFMTTKQDGNGIGLWITKRIIDSFGGTIKVEDGDKGGTKVIIFIPRHRKE